MAHPFAGQAKASQKARLRRLSATAGKPHGSSSMYKKKSLPGKNAGRDVGFTIPGGKARSRADRMANGGPVSASVGRRKGHHTTNITVVAPRNIGPGGGGGRGAPPPVVQHVHRHVAGPGVPIGGLTRPLGGPPVLPPGGGPPMGARPPLPVARPALPPLGAGVGAPGAGPPLPAPGMKSGGSVKKRKIGGDADRSPRGYRGFPHSPTTEVDSAVSARKRGGLAKSKFADGGDTQSDNVDTGADEDTTKPPSMQFGGPMGAPMAGAASQQQPPGFLGMPMPGRAPLPPQQGAPNISGRPARPAQPLTIPMPPTLASMRARPAPGTTTGYKRGGQALSSRHSDEAEDKKLFKRMYKEEEAKENKGEGKKRKRGGGIAPSIEGGHSVLGAVHADQRIGSVPKKSVVKGKTALPGEKYKDWGKGKRKHGGSAGDSIQQSRPHGQAGEIYRNLGTGYRARGGSVDGGPQAPYGSGSGLGRLRKEKSAAKVPAKTEV